MKAKIKKAFMDYVLEHEDFPGSVFVLLKNTKIKEEQFYEHYSSLESIESEIWLDFLNETLEKIKADEVYAQYSVREKLLAFYYTFLEVLKPNRSFAIYSYSFKSYWDITPDFLKKLLPAHKEFVEDLVLEGRESQVIADRVYITDYYPFIFKIQFLQVLQFWVKDQSENFEKTDVYIEKAVNFAFDFMGKNLLDSGFDYFKYVFQN